MQATRTQRMSSKKEKGPSPKVLRENRVKTNNEINTLYPYRTKHGTWVYDDDDLGVKAEAFVCGSSEVIDHLVGKETNHFTAHISENPIPGYQARLINIDERVKAESKNPKHHIDGHYQLEGTDMEHWLCGCVLDYFKDYPANIYVRIENLKS